MKAISLIAAANDTSALGARDAVRERKLERHIAIVGQDCIEEALARLSAPARPSSREDSTYGLNLIHLGLSILRGQTVPP